VILLTAPGIGAPALIGIAAGSGVVIGMFGPMLLDLLGLL